MNPTLEKKEAKKEELKQPVPSQETVPPVIPTQEVTTLQPTLVLSDEDAYILDVQKSQPKSIEEVLLVKERKYAPGEHRLSLPKEFKFYEDKLTFRWGNKKKRAIDDAKIKGWVIVNRTLFPDVARMAKHLFSTNGAVEKGDAILMFMSKKIAEQIRRAPGEKSNAMLKAQLNKGKQPLAKGQSGFYEPKNTTESEDESGQGQGFQEGRDFTV